MRTWSGSRLIFEIEDRIFFTKRKNIYKRTDRWIFFFCVTCWTAELVDDQQKQEQLQFVGEILYIYIYIYMVDGEGGQRVKSRSECLSYQGSN